MMRVLSLVPASLAFAFTACFMLSWNDVRRDRQKPSEREWVVINTLMMGMTGCLAGFLWILAGALVLGRIK